MIRLGDVSLEGPVHSGEEADLDSDQEGLVGTRRLARGSDRIIVIQALISVDLYKDYLLGIR